MGMGRDVAKKSAAAAGIFERADRVLGIELSRWCFEGPEDRLTRTDIQQPAIFTTSAAIWEAMVEGGASRDNLLGATAGLSLGEYTALYAAGAISFEDGLRLVHRRGQYMQEAAEASKGGMVSIVGGDRQAVEALCRAAAGSDELAPANFNCPGQIVISGSMAACERAVGMASEHGVRAVMLKVAGAFHSALMAPAAERLAAALAETAIRPPTCPVVSNVDAKPHGDPASIRAKLAQQLTRAVRWQESIERLIADGATRFIEIGPGRVLTGLMRKINRDVKTMNVSDAAGLEQALAGVAAMRS